MDRNWDTDNFTHADLTRPVQKMHLVAYVNPANEGDGDLPPTNHWATYFELSPQQLVCMDMAPGYGDDGTRGKILLASMQTPIDDAIHTLSLPLTGEHHTLQDLFDLVTRHGRQKYDFTPELEGCRYWIHTVVSDLEAAGLVARGSAVETWDHVSCYFRNPSGHEPREVRRGVFREGV